MNKKDAQERLKYLASYLPSEGITNEHDLIKRCTKLFDGYMITKSKKGDAQVYAEIQYSGIKYVASIRFRVPSCRKFYKRDRKRHIINLEYFGKDNELPQRED